MEAIKNGGTPKGQVPAVPVDGDQGTDGSQALASPAHKLGQAVVRVEEQHGRQLIALPAHPAQMNERFSCFRK